MLNSEFPLEMIGREIEGALKGHLYYLALTTALSVPDICCSLASTDARSNRGEYAKWYGRFIGNKYTYLTGDDCYRLRCGVSHEGRLSKSPSRPDMEYNNIVFLLPGSVIIANAKHGAAKIWATDLTGFCGDIIQGARNWYQESQEDPTVQSNLANLVRYRHGFYPLVNGVMVIA